MESWISKGNYSPTWGASQWPQPLERMEEAICDLEQGVRLKAPFLALGSEVASCQKGTIARSSSVSFYRTLVNYAEVQTNFIVVSMICDYVCSDHFRGSVGIQRSGLHRGCTYQQRYRKAKRNTWVPVPRWLQERFFERTADSFSGIVFSLIPMESKLRSLEVK